MSIYVSLCRYVRRWSLWWTKQQLLSVRFLIAYSDKVLSPYGRMEMRQGCISEVFLSWSDVNISLEIKMYFIKMLLMHQQIIFKRFNLEIIFNRLKLEFFFNHHPRVTKDLDVPWRDCNAEYSISMTSLAKESFNFQRDYLEIFHTAIEWFWEFTENFYDDTNWSKDPRI